MLEPESNPSSVREEVCVGQEIGEGRLESAPECTGEGDGIRRLSRFREVKAVGERHSMPIFHRCDPVLDIAVEGSEADAKRVCFGDGGCGVERVLEVAVAEGERTTLVRGRKDNDEKAEHVVTSRSVFV